MLKCILKNFFHPEILYTKNSTEKGFVYLGYPIKLSKEEYKTIRLKGKSNK
jgi:hypothetical protein